MKKFDSRRLKISFALIFLVVMLIFFMKLDIFTLSRYETTVTSSNNLVTAIYLLNDTYQTVSVKLPDVVPNNNQYTYTFSVSNYNATSHSDTNLKYRIHIRTTTNMHIAYDLFNTLDIDDAESCVVSNQVLPDENGTIFRHILTDEKRFLYNQDEIEYYTLLFTFPDDYDEYIYSGLVDYIEINVESSQILKTDVS
jgi:hypothetical protein